MKRDNDFVELAIPTADGEFLARYSENGLCGLGFPEGKRERAKRENRAQISREIRRWHAATTKALKRALTGQVPTNLPPVDLSSGTEFQRRVWETMRTIQRGRTLSYAEVAQRIGKPKAVRAVGGACGANPIPVFVPCHRVLAANQRLGGFSGGLDWKRRLLEREGVEVLAE
jgi:O-6-methylguanine DNA methyltransferase